MRSLLILLTIALPSIGASACGSSGKVAGSTPPRSSSATARSATAAGNASDATLARPLAGRSTQRYLNDNDGDTGGTRANSGYHDRDDGKIFAYGHTASAADGQAVTAVVKRYYAAATAGDGERACAMITPSLVKAVPEDYGQLGPSYLRGGKTCQAVMARLFSHFHSELTAPVAVTGVLVNDDHAYALLGSVRMRASYILLQRERGTWKIGALLGSGMP